MDPKAAARGLRMRSGWNLLFTRAAEQKKVDQRTKGSRFLSPV
jgi:hypothetical protein